LFGVFGAFSSFFFFLSKRLVAGDNENLSLDKAKTKRFPFARRQMRHKAGISGSQFGPLNANVLEVTAKSTKQSS